MSPDEWDFERVTRPAGDGRSGSPTSSDEWDFELERVTRPAVAGVGGRALLLWKKIIFVIYFHTCYKIFKNISKFNLSLFSY